jgi:hypothetical protein
MPYAPFIFALFVIGIGHTVLLNGVKAIFKLKFSSINLLMTIAVAAFIWENTGSSSCNCTLCFVVTRGYRSRELKIGIRSIGE